MVDAFVPNCARERNWAVITISTVEHGPDVLRKALAVIQHNAELVGVCHRTRVRHEI